MQIGVLGTGMVGTTIGTKLVQLGHDVMLGSRTRDNEAATAWVASAGTGAAQGTFADAVAHGELIVNCTAGVASIEALGSARPADLAGKTLVDVSNALEFPDGTPTLSVFGTDSLGEQIQRALPDTRVVKTLNTVNHLVMVDPSRVPGEHHVFVCGNDESAKATVVDLLAGFGWPRESVIDLGDITASRGVEAYLLFWIRLRSVIGTGDFNVRVLR